MLTMPLLTVLTVAIMRVRSWLSCAALEGCCEVNAMSAIVACSSSAELQLLAAWLAVAALADLELGSFRSCYER